MSTRSASVPVCASDVRVKNEELVPKILALNEPFQEVRSHVGSLTYETETSHSESTKTNLRREIEEIKKEVKTVKLPLPNGDIENKELYSLFPNGPIKKAAKIAGYPKPVSCV